MSSGKEKKTLVEALLEKYSVDEASDIKIFVKVPKGAPGYSGMNIQGIFEGIDFSDERNPCHLYILLYVLGN